ncbi:DUF2267 domain-containing protein [Pseudonocardia ammonioxydans]|uniref:DUF2267 domain-containing protein n=1 Tax=Pseudonocardia ammonioxydans TaxID=260086 RepID=UPI000B878F41|nr:DUF2267 domain-containing protein [Pseudonocardia ammonioxydans]
MHYDELCAAVRTRTDLSTANEASTAITGTIELLGRRLAGGEPANLAAQLPGEVQETLVRHTGPAEAFDVDEFLQRLADYEGPGRTPEQAPCARPGSAGPVGPVRQPRRARQRPVAATSRIR